MAGMMLLVDVGNSRVKWAFGTAAGFVALGEARHNEGEDLRALLDAAYSPAEIRVANVAGAEAAARLAALLHERFGIAPVFARSAASGAGVHSGYADPAQLGVDRWLAICAAFAMYRAPVCVVDAGTATTIDVVSGSGAHQGGLILPGITLMQSALRASTGDLARLSSGTGITGLPAGNNRAGNAAPVPGPVARSGEPGIALGRDTAAAIRDGALQATACLVMACLDHLRDGAVSGPGAGLLVLTGGAAPLLGPALLRVAGDAGGTAVGGLRLEYRPQLVLDGLALDPPCFQVAA
jgi:type III pantothenate kinase